MPHQQNDQPSKAEVQSTQLNKLPVPGEADTEFSEEDVQAAFRNQADANQEANDQQ